MYSNNQWGNVCHRVDTCALSGAAAFVAGIPGAEILVNGPLWCYFYALRNLEHAQCDMGERFHNCQPDNNAIVYGTEKYLTKVLQRLLDEERKPSLLLVESSCSLSLIGDDLAGIVRKMNLPYPFMTMDCGGLVGGFAEGYTKAAITFFEKYADKEVKVQSKKINLLGLSDFYFNGTADRKELCRILEKAGYEINTVPGSGSSFKELQGVGQASLNIVYNEELGLKLAQYLEKRFGTPYILAGLPYGTSGTQKWLEAINAALPCENLQAVLDECKEQAERLTAWGNDYRGPWGTIWFDKVAISAPGTQALCMAQALRNEWLDTGELVVVCQHDVEQSRYCDVADKVLVAGKDSAASEEVFAKEDKLLLLASSSESSNLRRKNCKFISCNIAFPSADEVLLTETPFVGIKGAAHMLQRLWNLYITSVMNKQVDK